MIHTQDLLANAVILLKQMLSIPSLTFDEGKRADFLFETLSKRALQLNASQKEAGRKGCIIVERLANNIVLRRDDFCREKKTLMLNSHIDTVPAAVAYSFDPFTPFEKDGAVYGLGSNDDGASVVSQIETFFFLNGERMNGTEAPDELAVNLMLVLTSEEERGGNNGMELFVKEYHLQPDYAIIGEPTDMEAAIAERGLLVLDGQAYGVSGHAARNEGINALYLALEDIQILRNYKFRKLSPIMGEMKLTVTQFNCGTAHNVIPAEATYVVDIRPTEQYSNSEILKILQKEIKGELKARNLKNKSSATPTEHPLMAVIEKLGIRKQISSTTSDWMKIPYPAIKMGPGDSARSHKADEYIQIAEIQSGIEGYINFIKHIK